MVPRDGPTFVSEAMDPRRACWFGSPMTTHRTEDRAIRRRNRAM